MFNSNKIIQKNRGMTYVELIVVLSIFSAMSSVVLFNYGDFQAKVDVKNLASDIALRVVEAQKSALSGKLPSIGQQAQAGVNWRPSYGIYFSINPISENKSFIYFVDIDQDGNLANPSCVEGGECLDKSSIIKENRISNLDVFYQDGTNMALDDLTITFSRPNSGAIFKSTGLSGSPVSYAQITVVSPKLTTGIIKVYSSGRVQVN